MVLGKVEEQSKLSKVPCHYSFWVARLEASGESDESSAFWTGGKVTFLIVLASIF